MHGEYSNLNQVLTTTKEVLVLDLLEFAINLNGELPSDVFVKPIEGLYVTGSIEPFIKLDGSADYFPKSKWLSAKNKLTDKKAILDCNEDIMDVNGKVVLSIADKKRKIKYIKTEPTIPATAIKVCISIVLSYINNLNPHTRRRGTTYLLEQLINSKYHISLVDNDSIIEKLEHLLDRVMEFVGNDTWNIYFHKVKGSTLIIDKCIDFRIYEWYRIKFEKEDNSNEE